MIPTTVEQYLGAKRVEAIGAGIFIDGVPDSDRIREAIALLLSDTQFRDRAESFATRYAHVTPEHAANDAAQCIIELLEHKVRDSEQQPKKLTGDAKK
jgi:UDP:flavonoid glycosyltransferase YjiC (YdhE family)